MRQPFTSRVLIGTVTFPVLACVAVVLLGINGLGQGSPNPQGPFSDSIERRRAEQDLRALPIKLRQRMDRNFSDPRILKQMNEDFLRIQAIRAEMVKAFGSNSKLVPQELRAASGDVKRRATRLRTMLALAEEHADEELRPDPNASLESVNARAFQLCLEISRFTGNPLFKQKGVITISHAKDASEALDAVIAMSAVLQKESARLEDN